MDNPHLREKTKDGKTTSGKMCYALDEVRKERLDILLESQRIGVDALVLDFCRQVPMLLYHESLVKGTLGIPEEQLQYDDHHGRPGGQSGRYEARRQKRRLVQLPR